MMLSKRHYLLPISKLYTTVKPLYNDHLGDKVSVVIIDRWCYEEDLCIKAKTANSDIWSLSKRSIIFNLITHDTVKNKSAFIFVQNKKQCCDKKT